MFDVAEPRAGEEVISGSVSELARRVESGDDAADVGRPADHLWVGGSGTADSGRRALQPVEQRADLCRVGVASDPVTRRRHPAGRRERQGRQSRPAGHALLQRGLRRRRGPRAARRALDCLGWLPLWRHHRDCRRSRVGDHRRRPLLPDRPLPPSRLGRVRRGRVAAVSRHRQGRPARGLQDRPPPPPLPYIPLCPLQLLLRPHRRRLLAISPRHAPRLRPRHRPLRLRRRGRLHRPRVRSCR
mmetsp:Transcript_6186/g.18715  ORF Transcript_6186/g.18715 Transcript_6186/m.18715 type:complete len:243 (-) Transcript_6186:389-1117(-)